MKKLFRTLKRLRQGKGGQPWIVYVLGAGASCEHGFPLYKDLLDPDYLNGLFKKANKADAKNIFEKNFQSLTAQSADLRSMGVGFEELMDRFYHEDPVAFTKMLDYYLDFLLVAESISGSSTPYYLVEGIPALIALHRMQGFRVGFISFNHDQLIEQSLANYQKYYPLSYCLSPENAWSLSKALGRNILFSTPEESMFTQPQEDLDIVPLLKLHGSFSWLRCRGCDLIFVHGDCIVKQGWITKCPRCKSVEIDAGVVPPRRAKEQLSLAGSWSSAKELLEGAKMVCFAGYSLPEYDADARALFKGSIRASTDVQVLAPVHTHESQSGFRSLFRGNSIDFIETTFSAYLMEHVEAINPHW